MTAQGINLDNGDLLLIRTGWAEWFLTEATADERQRIHTTKTCTGIAQSHEAIDWFADHHVALAASDTYALESLRPSRAHLSALTPITA